LGQDVREEVGTGAALSALGGRAEAERLVVAPAVDDIRQAVEGTAADEQDVRRVDLDILLLRVLPPALRRDVRARAFADLEQRLPAAGRADQEDVRLLKLDIPGGCMDALEVVIDGDGQSALGPLLSDDVLTQDAMDVAGFRDLSEARDVLRRSAFTAYDVIT